MATGRDGDQLLLFDLSKLQADVKAVDDQVSAADRRLARLKLSFARASADIQRAEAFQENIQRRVTKTLVKAAALGLATEALSEVDMPIAARTVVGYGGAALFGAQAFGVPGAMIAVTLKATQDLIRANRETKQQLNEAIRAMNAKFADLRQIVSENNLRRMEKEMELKGKILEIQQAGRKDLEDLMRAAWLAAPAV